MIRLLPLVLIAALAACETVPVEESPTIAPLQPVATGPKLSQSQATRNFNAVVGRLEPVAEQFCRQRTTGVDCNFRIIIDDRPDQGVNAYQTLDRNGRPIIAFTPGLIAEARNRDEIAFVMAHEAAHHIEGHIPRQQQNAALGAVLLGGLAGALGSTSADAINTAQQVGATVGARSYSKAFELEADALGTRITAAAGYDPLRGAQFFFRIPDPGDRFLGTHPPNADRLRTVQQVAASL